MTEPAAYLMSEETPGYQIPSSFVLKRVSGLRQVQVLRDDAGDVVQAHFADSTSARLRASEVRRLLNLSQPPRLVLVAVEKKARGPWWPTTVFAKAERVAAIGGAVLLLLNYGARLFVSPDLAIRAPKEVNTLARVPAEFVIPLFNRADADTRVDVDTSFPATLNPPTFWAEPRKGQDLVVRTSNPLTTDADVSLHVRARSGWLRWPLHQSASVRLIVWPSFRKGTQELVRVYADGHSAEVRVTFLVGENAPRGLSCSGTVVHEPGVTVEGARPNAGIGKLQQNKTAGNELAYLPWTVPPAEPFTVFEELVYLESERQKTPQQWQAVVAHLDVECHRRS